MGQPFIQQAPGVTAKFASYPEHIRPKLLYLRELILQTAADQGDISVIEESLKWGEPSYAAKKGSPIRIDWKEKNPSQYAMYFNCNTTLVETFKMEYGELFRYEKNRAILFGLEEDIPDKELRRCIELALTHHRNKHKDFFRHKDAR
ncbi:MAG: DUF1801 domain-containing protein [Bacteroidota bacterium]